MFGRFKPVPFDRYARHRRSARVPAWLWLLLIGLAGGAAGVVFVQERWLPPRLSADASDRLRTAFQQADADRSRLQAERDEATRKLQAESTRSAELARELAASQAGVERLRRDLASVVAVLPPDPRDGSVAVRGASFVLRGADLAYEVVLSRDRAPRPIDGVLQLTLAGEGGRGPETNAMLAPLPISIGSHEVLRGSVRVPEGLRPRQATVRILDRPGGQALGMRVLLVP